MRTVIRRLYQNANYRTANNAHGSRVEYGSNYHDAYTCHYGVLLRDQVTSLQLRDPYHWFMPYRGH